MGCRMEEDIFIRFLRKYYAEHGTINNIPYKFEVMFEGRRLCVYEFLKNMRNRHKAYLGSGRKVNGYDSRLSVSRYKALDEMGYDWQERSFKRREDVKTEDEILFLKNYYSSHGTINDIGYKTVVNFNGKILKIGSYLKALRERHAYYIKGEPKRYAFSEIFVERYCLLDEMGFDWTPKKKLLVDENGDIKKPAEKRDLYIEYLKYYYEKYGTINDIKANFVVTFAGENLKIGEFLSKMRYSYCHYKNGDITRNYGSELLKNRYQILEEMGFNFTSLKTKTLQDVAEEVGVDFNYFVKLYRKLDGNINKTIKISSLKKEKEEKRKKDEERENTLDNLLHIFNIDFMSLVKLLNRKDKKKHNKQDEVIYRDKMSLLEFCLENDYNYEVLLRVLKLKINTDSTESFESLFNRAIIEVNTNLKKPANWIYVKYGNEVLIKHMITFIGFNSTNILADMSANIISLEEAFKKASFNKFSKNKYQYLEEIYLDYVEFYQEICSKQFIDMDTKLVAKMEELIQYYELNQEEFSVIRNAFFSYTDAVNKFQLCDVGFEKDPNKRINKILNYQLDSDDIEEAFFIPLKFNEGVLLGRDSELYKRRVLLKNLTVSWDVIDDEEKLRKISQYRLTDEEVNFVVLMRNNIDQVKQRVLKQN